MDAGVVDDLVVISRPNLPVFPVFFAVIRKFEFGDWFESDCVVSHAVGLCAVISGVWEPAKTFPVRLRSQARAYIAALGWLT
jgi:hypothetical protein